jgi:hypothetical protein
MCHMRRSMLVRLLQQGHMAQSDDDKYQSAVGISGMHKSRI